MRILGFIAAGIGLSGCGSQVSSLPAAFQGQWDLTPALCQDVDGVSRVTIDATGLGYYESSAILSGPALKLGDRVSGRFEMGGTDFDYEGVTPKDLHQSGELVLTDGGTGLIVTFSGRRLNYVRCARNRV
ncbi:hypothetical protein BH09PSE1_BH09PSE1_02300 [soil metagenome]